MVTALWRHEITFATVRVTDDDVSYCICNGPGMFMRKTAKPFINCTWIALVIIWISVLRQTVNYVPWRHKKGWYAIQTWYDCNMLLTDQHG